MAELEKALESGSAKSKKRLDEAEQREIELMQAEKVEISRLLALASHVGGKRSSLFVFFIVFPICILRINLVFCVGQCGAAPPPNSSCDNVTLPQAVSFIDKVCAYAFAAIGKASGALSVVHQGMFPNKAAPSSVEGLAAPFGAGSTIMTDYTRSQTVRGSEFTFQLLLGHKVECDYEKVAGEFPKRPDGKTVSVSHTKSEASRLAQKLVDTYQKRVAKALEAAARKSRSESAC